MTYSDTDADYPSTMPCLFCERAMHQVSALVCIYRCALRTRLRCAEYAKRFEQIRSAPVPARYLEKYGAPQYGLPYARRPRRVK